MGCPTCWEEEEDAIREQALEKLMSSFLLEFEEQTIRQGRSEASDEW